MGKNSQEKLVSPTVPYVILLYYIGSAGFISADSRVPRRIKVGFAHLGGWREAGRGEWGEVGSVCTTIS